MFRRSRQHAAPAVPVKVRRRSVKAATPGAPDCVGCAGWVRAAVLGFLLAVSAAGGCARVDHLMTPERLNSGYTVILPGVNGRGRATSNIARGLADGGVGTAIEVHDWTTGNPLLTPLHLYGAQRNQRAAHALAAKIVDYQNQYPGRPVHLVSLSAGSGMTLWALEALPPGRRVTSAVLLSSAVSPTYDVRPVLEKTTVGIWNFYSPADVAMLAGTVLTGTVDGRWMPAAGAIGFVPHADYLPEPTDSGPRLRQIPYQIGMARSGNYGGHWGTSPVSFNRDYVAPILLQAQRGAAGQLAAQPIVNRQTPVANGQTPVLFSSYPRTQ